GEAPDTFILSGAEDLVPVAGDFWEVRGRDRMLTRYGTRRPAQELVQHRQLRLRADDQPAQLRNHSRHALPRGENTPPNQAHRRARSRSNVRASRRRRRPVSGIGSDLAPTHDKEREDAGTVHPTHEPASPAHALLP